jgi:hypothetical protein
MSSIFSMGVDGLFGKRCDELYARLIADQFGNDAYFLHEMENCRGSKEDKLIVEGILQIARAEDLANEPYLKAAIASLDAKSITPRHLGRYQYQHRLTTEATRLRLAAEPAASLREKKVDH